MVLLRKLRPTYRLLSSSLSTGRPRCGFVSERLVNRSAIRVSGKDASPFLQGLITNDMNKLEQSDHRSLYTVFLNVQGRIMFDAVIFRDKEDFIVDCDSSLSSMLAKHLKLYKVRRKINLTPCVNFQTWAVFKNEGVLESETSKLNEDLINQSIAAADPRSPEDLGYRVLVSDADNELVNLLQKSSVVDPTFKSIRYRHGIAEGADEIPLGKSFPLEYNIDLLNGVDFHKGCYIGQELTARTHYTGVVRKRILPIQFHAESVVETGQIIINENKKNVGQIRGVANGIAVGLLRIEDCLKANSLVVKETEVPVEMILPPWWSQLKTFS